MLLIAEPSKAWWKSPSPQRRESRRQYDARPEAHARKLARQKRYYYRHRESRLDGQRKVNYRIPRGTYRAMFIHQDGLCAICRRIETGRYKGRVKSLAVDHDQVTGKIRALLCQSCNRGIGSFRHDPDRLRSAIAYLRSNSTSFIDHSPTLGIGPQRDSRLSWLRTCVRGRLRDGPGSPSPRSGPRRAMPRWRK